MHSPDWRQPCSFSNLKHNTQDFKIFHPFFRNQTQGLKKILSFDDREGTKRRVDTEGLPERMVVHGEFKNPTCV